MKKYIPYLVIFLIGALAGMWAHRQYHFRDATNMPQNDTIVRLDTVKYSKLELIGKNYRLDIPKVSMKELVYIPSDSTTIIYRDSIRYVTLPRQYFYTKVGDAEIWHSGIDSTIDSLNVVRKTQEITKATQTVTHRNALTFGIEPSYLSTFSIPIYLEYERMLHKNVGIYGRINYDLQTKMFGAGIGAKVSIGW
jgi:hypothetical protein